MEKDRFVIDREFILKMGLDPDNGAKYLESKEASTIDPVHVKALQILKRKPVVSS